MIYLTAKARIVGPTAITIPEIIKMEKNTAKGYIVLKMEEAMMGNG